MRMGVLDRVLIALPYITHRLNMPFIFSCCLTSASSWRKSLA